LKDFEAKAKEQNLTSFRVKKIFLTDEPFTQDNDFDHSYNEDQEKYCQKGFLGANQLDVL
jgi:hypothetical protein